jgi:hypothetical protein
VQHAESGRHRVTSRATKSDPRRAMDL